MHTDNPPPQITIKGMVLGIVLAVVLAGANAYLGLFAGLTVSASIPAAVVSMAVLSFFRESNILENNIVQTTASAGQSVAAGVIFTLPALIILGYWDVFHYWWVAAIAGLGGLLGIMFSIPLRRSLIVEQKLAYPEGTATAEVLKVGEDPGSGLKYLAVAAIAGGLIKFVETGLRLWSGTAQAATYVGQGTIAYAGTNLSPALLGVGYIVGFNIAVLVFAGGAISWYFAIPIYTTFFLDADPAIAAMIAGGESATDVAGAVWSTQIRYLGVGAMLIGGIWALISLRNSILSGVKSGMRQYSAALAGTAVHHTEMDTPMQYVLAGIVLFVIPIFFLYQHIVGSFGIGLVMTLIMVVAGFLFSSVAGYMAGLVGSSNNPISGITIATILFASLLLLWLMGPDSSIGAAAAILIGAVVCCAAAIAGDNLQDLKAGYIVGSTPWKQQLALSIGAVSAVFVLAPILNLLLKAYGIGVPTEAQPDPLLAPQATLMASVAKGVFGGGLPWTMVGLGVGIGIAIIVTDEILKARGAKFRAPVLAVAVGIYLPLELSVPIFFGGVVSLLAARHNARRGSAAQTESNMRTGMLFAAGLITGEALIGIFMAIPIVVSGDASVLAIADEPFAGLPGLPVVALLAYVLYRISRGPAYA
ncbi:MAG TPA: oligopeptide transporter, OPT family [Gammaproteobacteria bacterium]|nr:oligopeptide transporter, OPT family [Gammaproteobacteria bacterium]